MNEITPSKGAENKTQKFIRYLHSFNRKERFWLIGEALGNRDFILGSDFQNRLAGLIGDADFSVLDALRAGNIPDKKAKRKLYFCSMDYHLDWIFASLYLANVSRGKACECHPADDDNWSLKGTIEDVDFIVVVPSRQNPSRVHLIMIEAKGDTSWKSSQLKSKVERMNKVFRRPETSFVVPHYILVSPLHDGELRPSNWDTITGHFEESERLTKNIKFLPFGNLKKTETREKSTFLKIVRCKENRKPDRNGTYWRLEPVALTGAAE